MEKESGEGTPLSAEENSRAEATTGSVIETARSDEEYAAQFRELATMFGLPAESVRAAVTALGAGQQKGVDVLRALAPSCVAIKGRFQSRRRGGMNGAFAVIAFGSSGEIREQAIWAGASELPEGFSVDAGWESVRKALHRSDPPPDVAAVQKVEAVLKPLLAPTAVNLFFQSPDSVGMFSSRFREALSDQFRVEFSVDVRFERVSILRLEKELPVAKAAAESTGAASEDPFSAASDLRVVCTPVIDPVRGVPVNHLRVGHVVDVSFDKTEGFGRLVGRLVQQMGRDSAFPVSEIRTLPSGDFVVHVAISDDVTGVMKLPPTFRVRLHEPKARPRLLSRILSLGLFFEGLLFFLAVFLLALLVMHTFLR